MAAWLSGSIGCGIFKNSDRILCQVRAMTACGLLPFRSRSCQSHWLVRSVSGDTIQQPNCPVALWQRPQVLVKGPDDSPQFSGDGGLSTFCCCTPGRRDVNDCWNQPGQSCHNLPKPYQRICFAGIGDHIDCRFPAESVNSRNTLYTITILA
jgi:hypothetical protein